MLNLATTWDAIPTPGTQTANIFRLFYQPWQAMQERQWALGNLTVVTTNNIWWSGHVGSVAVSGSSIILTDAGTDGGWRPPDPDFSGSTWAGGSSPNTSYFRPTSYDCIISFDDRDPSQQVRAHITGDVDPLLNEDGSIAMPGTLTLDTYVDYVTANVIPSITPPGNARYFIIKRDGLWWADKDPTLGRVPDYPNDPEEDYGTISAATTTTAILNSSGVAAYAAMRAATSGEAVIQKFSDNTFQGDDFMVYIGGRLKRIPIVASTTDPVTGYPLITFAAQAAAPAGDYTILKSGDMGFPGRTPVASRFNWWYSGPLDQYYVHDPTDPAPGDPLPSRGTLASNSISFKESDDSLSACGDDTFIGPFGMDTDVWSSYQNKCSTPDFCYTPYLYKSLRGLQSLIELLAPNFIPPLQYPIAGRSPEQPFTTALLFDFAKVNNFTDYVHDKTMLSGESTENYHFYAGTQWAGRSVLYTFLRGTDYGYNCGIVRDFGSAVVRADGYVSLGSGLFDETDEESNPSDYSDVGLTVYWSLGWSTHNAKRVRYIKDHYFFRPDVNEGAVVYPANVVDYAEDGPRGAGTWLITPKSTNYLTFDDTGAASDSGAAFADGDIALYHGSGSWDIPIDPATQAGGDDGTMPYYDRVTEMRHTKSVQDSLAADATGVITSCNAYSFTDSSKDWWKSWFGGGEMRVNSGTLTAGSSTSFTDSTWASGENSCYAQASRFNGYAFPFAGFVVEIDHGTDAHGNPITYKMPLTGLNPATFTGTFASVGVNFSAGDAWRIREPGTELNRYAGNACQITNPDNSQFVLTTQQSDRQTAYFDPSAVAAGGGFQVGATYQFGFIDPVSGKFYPEMIPGGTYIRSGSGWSVPTGTDTRPGANGFKANPQFNSPDWVADYGKIKKFDFAATIDVWTQIKATINALVRTDRNVGWTSRKDGVTPENNDHDAEAGADPSKSWPTGAGGGVGVYADYGTAWASRVTEFNTEWSGGGGLLQETDGVAPMATLLETVHGGDITTDVGMVYDLQCERLYAYPTTTAPIILASATRFYCYGIIDPTDPDEGMASDWPGKLVNHFDAEGSNLVYRQWALVASIGVSDISPRISQQSVGPTDLSSLPTFTQPDDPLPHQPAQVVERVGFAIGAQTAQLLWNEPGGMKFVDPAIV